MKKILGGYSRNSRRRRPDSLSFERVEPRMMLAGDVSVFVTSGQLLVIGDGQANQIQVIGTADGRARVIGLEGTTINGGPANFRSAPGLNSLLMQLNGGDDSARLQGLVVPGRLELQGNNGNDSLEVLNSFVGMFSAMGGNGDDILQPDNVFVADTALISMGAGNDIISVNALAAGRYVGMFTGDGDDVVAINDLQTGRLLALGTGSGDDLVLLAGQTSSGTGSGISLGSGADFLGILPGQTGQRSSWRNALSIEAGAGDDQVALDSNVSTGLRAILNGRSGFDRLRHGGASFGSAMIENFEAGAIGNLSQTLDALFERLADADIDPQIFGGPELVRALSVSTSPTGAAFTENGDPVVVDENLELRGPRDAEVVSATVAIRSVTAADSLEFLNTPDISGSYDSGSGVLNLFGTGDLAGWEAALRTVRYANTSDDPVAERTITFTVNIVGETASAVQTVNIASVPDAPVLTVTSDTRTLDLDDPAQSLPLVLDDSLTLTDPDTPEFNTGLVSISIASGLRSGDVLGFTPVAGVTGTFNPGTGVLALSGTATTQQLETLLRSLTFDTNRDDLQTGSRIINISVFDGSLTSTRNIQVDVIASESITIAVSNVLLSFTETDDPVAVDADLTVTPGVNATSKDVDSASVQFSSGYVEGQDMLEFTPAAGITGSFDATTGILEFTGLATASEYESLLRTVRYANSATGDDLVAGDRRVEFRVVAGGSRSVDTRVLRVSPASEQRLIENYLQANNLTSEQTGSGLHYIIEQEGNGNFPTVLDSVTVNYRGFLLDGTSFDGRDGVTFELAGVIDGWQEGIPLFSVGGSGQLIIPSDLAYGEQGFPPNIGPNEILRFEIELLAISPQPSSFEILDVCLDGHDDVVAHDHAELNILIDGQPVVIAGDIGIDDAECTGLRGMHTHDATGTIHIETPAAMDAPLGAFFEIWGRTFNQNQILDNVANSEKEVVMFVNGQLNNQFENYLVQDDDVIEILYRDRSVG